MAKDSDKEDTDKEDSKLIRELLIELYMQSEKVLKKLKWYVK